MSGTKACILHTYTGKPFNFGRLENNVIDPRDIAKALSKLCRFNGHTTSFYSVAEHSVNVSYKVPPHLALQGLLHDAAEAYTGDISTPLKNALDVLSDGAFRRWETLLEADIRVKLSLPVEFDPLIKEADLLDYGTALNTIMNPAQFEHDYHPPIGLQPLDCWPHYTAHDMFIDRWIELDPKVAVCFDV